MIKKIIKWVAGLLIILLLGILIAVGILYAKAFRLEPWEYTSQKVKTDKLPERPNILLLVAEDMSLRVGAFGDSLAHTPNLDKLASEGVRFPNTFTTAGVCAPSRAGLITGMNQISMGGQHMRCASRPAGGYKCVPPPEVKAYPELLRAAGYYTFNIAKEDYQFSGMMTGSGPFTIWDDEDNNKLWRARPEGKPFFGMINFMETHESGLFSPLGTVPHSMIHFMLQVLRPAMLMSRGKTGVKADPDKISVPPYFPDNETVRKDMATFYYNISLMDMVIGDILKRLEKDGLAESTIIIWTTDHGDCLPRGKRDLYDSGLKVPMIIRWPEAYRPKGLEPGMLDERMISFVDLAPTILGMANVPKMEYMQGHDFINDTVQRQYIFASRDRMDEVYDRQRAVRDNRFEYIRSWYPKQPEGCHIAFRDNIEMMRNMWKLKDNNKLNRNQLLWFMPPGEERLYDIQNDPYQLHDLSTDTAYTDVLNRMRNALDNWLSRIGDWSEVTEDEMVARFMPDGHQIKTPKPAIAFEKNLISINCVEKGASIGYKINNGPWLLYTRPFPVPDGGKITAKAIRYGWKESEEVKIDL